MPGTILYPVQVPLRLGTQLLAVRFDQDVRKPGNLTEWGAQVMGYRIGKGFQLGVSGRQFRGAFEHPALQLAIQQVDFAFGALALGDVDDRAKHPGTVVGLDGVQADLHRKFAAALSQPAQIPACSHRAGPRLVHELRPVCGMFAPISEGNQDIHFLADQLVAPVPEELLRLVVDQNDFALRVRHDHGARGRLDNQPEHLLGPLALGDIDDRAEHPDPFIGLYGV